MTLIKLVLWAVASACLIVGTCHATFEAVVVVIVW